MLLPPSLPLPLPIPLPPLQPQPAPASPPSRSCHPCCHSATHRQGQGQGEGQEQGKGQDQGEGQEQNQQPQRQAGRKRGSAAGPRDKHTERMGQEVVEVFGRCGSADQQAQLLDRVLTSPQLPVAVQQAMQQCPTTKQRVACLLLDRVQLLMDSGTCGKKGGQHTDDVTARKVLARLVPPELLEQQLVSAFAQQTGMDRHWVSEAARQNLEQRASIEDHPACVSASARLSG
ncbi:hypothetical protein V8C86DRAFT_2964239 [Haematococcus lacustris]